MIKDTIQIHNVKNDTIIVRDLTDLEQIELDNSRALEKELKESQAAQLEAEAEARATQKAALLERLGITEDEAKLLLA
jgi:post-segregation antitoxin (ccd killing protein)